MKNAFIHTACLLALLALFGLPAHTYAQDAKNDKAAAKELAIKNMVDSQHYVFVAQTVLPLSGRSRQLTSDYDVKVSPTSIICDLPYFGRAYQAPIDPSQGGLHFTSKDFEYTVTPGKKQGWTIIIKPKDFKDVQQMTLGISSSGYASLQVTSINKQPISFNGIIRAPRTKK